MATILERDYYILEVLQKLKQIETLKNMLWWHTCICTLLPIDHE